MIRLFAAVAAKFGVNPKEAERFAKFVVVGTIGFVIDFGTLTFLVEVVDLPGIVSENTPYSEITGLVLANTISFSLAVVSNFTLNRFWTYPESRAFRKRVQLPQFTAVSIAGLLINNLIFATSLPIFAKIIETVSFIPDSFQAYFPAKVLATVVVLFWNFFVNRYWTYRHVDHVA
ncbi:MAG: GtrA family protein [Candidatus Promineifilaceae bacterium]|jgi:putative flippase GtrA